jgi:hypothetical protein
VGAGDQDKVVSREMPPWGADPKESLPMRNDISLSDAQIRTLVAWVDGGAPKGDLADLPPAPTFATGWTYGKEPDAILEMPVEFDIPAEGELGVQMFYSKVPWTEDRFAEVVELRPGNGKVVHHAGIYFVDIPEGTTLVDGRMIGPDGKVIGDRGSRGTALVTTAVCPDRASCCRGCRDAVLTCIAPTSASASRRQVRQLADALQPDGASPRRTARVSASGSTRCR